MLMISSMQERVKNDPAQMNVLTPSNPYFKNLLNNLPIITIKKDVVILSPIVV